MKKNLFLFNITFLLFAKFSFSQDSATVAQLKTKIEELNDKFDKANNKIVKFGISVGYNNVYKNQLKNYQSASIDIKDTTLKLETMDPSAVKLSTSILITPFKKTAWLNNLQDRIQKKIDYFELINDTATNKRAYERMIYPDSTYKSIRKRNKKVQAHRLGFRYAGSLLCTALENFGFAININLIDFNKAQQEFTFNKSIEGGIGICYRLHDKVYLGFNNELYFSRQLRESVKSYENQKLYLNGQLITSSSQLDMKDDNLFITKSVIASSFKIIIVL